MNFKKRITLIIPTLLVVLFIATITSASISNKEQNLSTEKHTRLNTGQFNSNLPLWKITGALVIVMSGLLALGYIARKYAKSGTLNLKNNSSITIEEKVFVGDKAHILVVSWNKKKYLIGKTSSRFTLLDSVTFEKENKIHEIESQNKMTFVSALKENLAPLLEKGKTAFFKEEPF